MRINQPGVAGEIEVVVSDVGDVGNSLGGRLEMAAPLPISEHLVLPCVKTYPLLPDGFFHTTLMMYVS